MGKGGQPTLISTKGIMNRQQVMRILSDALFIYGWAEVSANQLSLGVHRIECGESFIKLVRHISPKKGQYKGRDHVVAMHKLQDEGLATFAARCAGIRKVA